MFFSRSQHFEMLSVRANTFCATPRPKCDCEKHSANSMEFGFGARWKHAFCWCHPSHWRIRKCHSWCILTKMNKCTLIMMAFFSKPVKSNQDITWNYVMQADIDSKEDRLTHTLSGSFHGDNMRKSEWMGGFGSQHLFCMRYLLNIKMTEGASINMWSVSGSPWTTTRILLGRCAETSVAQMSAFPRSKTKLRAQS